MRGSRQLRRTPEGALVEIEGGGGGAPPTPSAQARLQRAVGNQGLQAALAEAAGRPHATDPHEREADAFAAGSTTAPAALGGGRDGAPGEASRAEREVVARLGKGAALPGALRASLEGRLGLPLGGVQVHRGTEAAALAREAHARAFTTGEQIVLGEGAAQTDAALLAHESAHVAQQASASDAPAVQCQPVPATAPGPDFTKLLADLVAWVAQPRAASNPPAIQAALQSLTGFGITLGTVQFTRLANASWVIGGLHVRAESRWQAGGIAEISIGDDMLTDLGDFLANPQANTARGFDVIRTLAHELRHLERERQRTGGTRAATTTESRYLTEITQLAAATPARLTPQEYSELYSGRVLYAQTAYPVEEILARLEEVTLVGTEWAAMRTRAGGARQQDRERIEEVLTQIGFRIYYQINVLRSSTQVGAAGLVAADLQTSIAEVEAEIARRYGPSSPQKRLWDHARAGGIGSEYPQSIRNLVPSPGGLPGDYDLDYTLNIVLLPLVFP